MERNQNTIVWIETDKNVWEAVSIVGKVVVFKSILKDHDWMISLANQPKGEYNTCLIAKRIAESLIHHQLSMLKDFSHTSSLTLPMEN